jgi:hypothetical protein
MKTKLTLTVEADIIDSAKQLARKNGTSVSSLFEQWAMRMAAQTKKGSSMESLAGLWKEDLDDTQDLENFRIDAMLDKFGS